MPRITLKTIAEEAGCTAACVSQALSGQGRVSPERLAQIKAIAQRLGYRPDPLLASLAAHRFRPENPAQGTPLALLEFPIGASYAVRPAGKERLYRQELRRAAARLGYAPQVHKPPADGRHDTLARVLYHRGVRAIVATGRPAPAFFAEPQRWATFALVQCGRASTDTPLHTVRPDIIHAIDTLFRQARARGYRRIGFAPGSHPGDGIQDDRTRLGAILALLEKETSPADRIPPFTGDLFSDRPRARAAFTAWARRHRADAYVGFSSDHWWWLREAGILCPRDAGFAALHVLDSDLDREPFASGINQCTDEIARQALLLADQMVRHGEAGLAGDQPRQMLVREKWVEGKTLPPRRREERQNGVRGMNPSKQTGAGAANPLSGGKMGPDPS